MRRFSLASLISVALVGLAAASAMPQQGDKPPMLPGDRPQPKPAPQPDDLKKQTIADQIARAHMKDAWDKQPALQCAIDITFTDHDPFRAMLLYDDALHGAQLKTRDATVIYDGKSCWVTPASAELPGARFHAQTWPFVIAAPFELHRDGVRVEDLGVMRLQEKPYRAAKVTFRKGMRDAADDWFILYADPVTFQVRAMGYSIGTGDESHESERATAAITFENFGIVNGVVFSSTWTFWDYTETDGIVGEPIGHGKLSQIEFKEADADAFDKPADAREEKPAGSDDEKDKPTE